MTRFSQAFLPTLKEAPSDAEAISHKLMVRAGLVRQLGAGLWTYLPAGLRVKRKVEAILREEMEAIGCQEMLMPVLQPADAWQKTGRYAIEELFKLEDRKGSPMVLAMTHEECVTQHVAREVRSYRDLPLMLFHIQTKERDEARPRAGVLRTREFTMKDAYSFDRDEEGMQRSYEAQAGAYDRIFDRCGLRWHRVESDVGMMGGSGAHEYMAPCPAGENEIALAPGYAANVEVASAEPQAVALPATLPAPEEVSTPGATTIDEVSAALELPAGALVKALPVIVEGRGMVVVAIRGDHRLNEIKLRNALGSDFRQASAAEIEAELGPVGFIGPVGTEVPVLKDAAIDGESYATGANRPDTHLRGVMPGRDFRFEEVDVRTVEAGDSAPGGGTIEIEPAIEVGNIFKLGTRYSEPLGATYLDESGQERLIFMGSYGIGPARIVAADDRAGRRRARHRLARLAVALAGASGLPGQAGRGGALRRRQPLRAPLRGRRRGPLRRSRRRARPEADRRRAARLPAAARGRSPRPRQRRRRGQRAGQRRRARPTGRGGGTACRRAA